MIVSGDLIDISAGNAFLTYVRKPFTTGIPFFYMPAYRVGIDKLGISFKIFNESCTHFVLQRARIIFSPPRLFNKEELGEFFK